MGIDIKKIKDKRVDKLITIILVGILILVVIMPVSKQDKKSSFDVSGSESANIYDSEEAYYEKRLKKMLEESYGKENIEVMVYMRQIPGEVYDYSSKDKDYEVDGVLVVARVDNEEAVSDITFAISALFNIPTHKVAVIINSSH